MKILDLVLQRPWFEDVKSGKKKIEYRETKPYWRSRIEGKGITHLRFRHGYYGREVLLAKVEKITVGPCPYKGWDGEFFQIHFKLLKGGEK